MKLQYIITVLLAVVLILVVAGCNGSSPGLNPTIEFTFGEETTLPSVPSGGTLVITGEVNTDTEGDQITDVNWVEVPDPDFPDVTGVIVSPGTVNTVWQAPEWNGAEPLAITLVLTVDTLLGGHTTKELNLRVLPAAIP